MALTLGELAEKVDGELVGDPQCPISGVSTLQNARPNTISFLANPAYRKYLAETKASAVILRREELEHCKVSAIVASNPYATYARIASIIKPPPVFEPGVHPSAVVGDDVSLGDGAFIGANCVIEDGVRIGADSYIGSGCVVGRDSVIGDNCRLICNVTVCHECTLGSRIILHPGVVIGSDGFGLANEDGRWLKVPQLGAVRLGDDVEVGANTTIDRGAVEDTVLEEGVKLDNQIQVAHNVYIGAHTAVAGCVGISGSTRIGRYCAIAGGVGLVGHIEIADHVQITGMSMVTKSIDKPGVYSSGMAAQPNDIWLKNSARFRQLDEMARRLRELEKKINSD